MNGTAMFVKPCGLAVDCGVASSRYEGIDHLAITHTHLDHCSELAKVLFVRQCKTPDKPLNIYGTTVTIAAIKQILAAYEGLGEKFNYTLRPMVEGSNYSLEGGYALSMASTNHLSGSCMFILHKGTDHMFTFTGDISADDMERNAEKIFNARFPVVECTFVGEDEKESAMASLKRHTTLVDIGSIVKSREALGTNPSGWAFKKIILTHWSPRYKETESEDMLMIAEKICFYLGDRAIPLLDLALPTELVAETHPPKVKEIA
jgi:ribonuclease BN (tRNA processing enzyme)